jgi:hypothetical protein
VREEEYNQLNEVKVHSFRLLSHEELGGSVVVS